MQGREQPVQDNTTDRGAKAEQAAARFLQQQGLQLLEKNFRCKSGELDIIFREGNTLVFVEVRYRRNIAYGYPAETVNRKKQKKLLTTAKYYLQIHAPHVQCRFDVIEVTLQHKAGKQRFEFNWIKNAFDQCW